MRKIFFVKSFACILTVVLSVSAILGQKAKPIVFAVLHDGKTLEPIALIDKGGLIPASDGGDEIKILTQFTRTYYKPKATYRLVFGGVDAGTVTIKSADPKMECSSNQAQVSTQTTKAKLGGFVMALATNAPPNNTEKGLRRQPTTAERGEITSLVSAEFTKQKVSADALKNLNFHNMTAIDVDDDGRAEIVGTAWVTTSKTDRAVLFFIADKNKAGKYAFGFSEFKAVNQEEVMSGEIEAIDTGIYCEVLLDGFDYNGDKVDEIFTYTPGFEGSGFSAFRRDGGKWIRAFEGANYHCGY